MRQIHHAARFHLFPLAFLILVTAGGSARASIVLLEDFETDGEGVRYTSAGAFTDGADDYFIRTDGDAGASGIPGYTGFGGSWFWAAEDTDASDNLAGMTLLDFSGIDLGGAPAIQLSLHMGAASGSAFDSLDDFLFVQYRVDGGLWQTALAFQNNGQTYNGPLLQDTDFDGIGDGIQLDLALQTFTSPVFQVDPGIIDVRIDTLMTSGSEEIAFDNLTVMAVPEPATTALVFASLSLLMILYRRFLPRRED